MIAAAGTPVRARWEQLFRDHQLEPPPLRIECGAELTVRGLLLEDDWLTLMSRDQFVFERLAGLLAEIGSAGPQLRRQIGMTTRSDWYPPRAVGLRADLATGLRRTRADGRCAGGLFRYCTQASIATPLRLCAAKSESGS